MNGLFELNLSNCPEHMSTINKSQPEEKRPSNDELVDNLIERAGGISTFHIVFYLAIGCGSNCIRAFMNYLIPFQIQK